MGLKAAGQKKWEGGVGTGTSLWVFTISARYLNAYMQIQEKGRDFGEWD